MTFIEADLCILSFLISVMSFDNSKEIFFETKNFLFFSFPIPFTCLSFHYSPCFAPHSYFLISHSLFPNFSSSSTYSFISSSSFCSFSFIIPLDCPFYCHHFITIFHTFFVVKHFFCPFCTFIFFYHFSTIITSVYISFACLVLFSLYFFCLRIFYVSTVYVNIAGFWRSKPCVRS